MSAFVFYQALNQSAKNKISVVGLGALNLAEYTSKTKEELTVVKVPLTVSNIAVENHPSLFVSNYLILITSILMRYLLIMMARPLFEFADISRLSRTSRHTANGRSFFHG